MKKFLSLRRGAPNRAWPLALRVTCLTAIALCLGCPIRAESPAPFGTSDRFASIVQSYGGTGPHQTVWAIQPGRIVVYDQSGNSGSSNRLLGDFVLQPVQESSIRKAAAKIRREAQGKMWFTPDVDDGVSLLINFARDGTLRDDDIVLSNIWRAEFRDLCVSISSVLPKELKITFEDLVTARPDQDRFTVVAVSTKDFRKKVTGVRAAK